MKEGRKEGNVWCEGRENATHAWHACVSDHEGSLFRYYCPVMKKKKGRREGRRRKEEEEEGIQIVSGRKKKEKREEKERRKEGMCMKEERRRRREGSEESRRMKRRNEETLIRQMKKSCLWCGNVWWKGRGKLNGRKRKERMIEGNEGRRKMRRKRRKEEGKWLMIWKRKAILFIQHSM